MNATRPTIYDQLGGSAAVAKVVDVFYGLVLDDSTLSPHFAGVDLDHLKAHQRAFIAGAIGGPEIYAGRRLDLAHAGLNITDADFDRVAELLMAALLIAGAGFAWATTVVGQVDELRGWVVGVPAGGNTAPVEAAP